MPNKYTLGLFPDLNPGLYAPEDLTDYSGHGTHVASVATGGVYGVASKADLVIVKFRNAAVNPFNLGTGRFLTRGVTQVALLDAWSWIINDVADQKQKGNAGKFFINMSYGKSISTRSKLAVNRISSRLFLSFDVIHQDGRESVMNRVLNECWDNDGEIGKTLDETTPQNAGTTSNGLITVGGVDSDGMLHDITNFKSDRRGGSITVYVVSKTLVSLPPSRILAPRRAMGRRLLLLLWYSGLEQLNIANLTCSIGWSRRVLLLITVLGW